MRGSGIPFRFFQSAVTVQYDSVVNGKSTQPFFAALFADGRDLTEVEEKGQSVHYEVRCTALRSGEVAIYDETTLEKVKSHEFHALGFPGKPGRDNAGKDLKMQSHERPRQRPDRSRRRFLGCADHPVAFDQSTCDKYSP